MPKFVKHDFLEEISDFALVFTTHSAQGFGSFSMPISLELPKELREVSRLDFCYICGSSFIDEDKVNRDHVPPKNTFHVSDRGNPLILKTHVGCNEKFSVTDKKIGQLIGLLLGKQPKEKRDASLDFTYFNRYDLAAVTNINLEAAVWRWVRGFHSALYKEPLLNHKGTLRTPLASFEMRDEGSMIPLLPQHAAFVQIIKNNKFLKNLDTVEIYNRKLKYHCVWIESDNSTGWMCVFALDIYGWKKLGAESPAIPRRGCAGMYSANFLAPPKGAARNRKSNVILPNHDRLDAFSP